MKRIIRKLATLILCLGLIISLSGCGYQMVYMLDQPVSDPLMYADDAQDSDLCKVEDGGYSGASGASSAADGEVPWASSDGFGILSSSRSFS